MMRKVFWAIIISCFVCLIPNKVIAGSVTAQSYDADLTDFPAQAGNNGKVLTTDGTNLSWGSTGSGDALVYGTPSVNQLAVWHDDDEVGGVDYFKLPPLSSQPSQTTGAVYLANNDDWDPSDIAGTTDYYVLWDGSGWVALWDVTGNYFVSSIQAQTPIAGDADDFDTNCTDECLYGGTYIANAAGTIDLPAIAEGMNVTIVTSGDYEVILDPNGTEDIYAIPEGQQGSGATLTNGSTDGDMAVCQYYDSNGWVCMTNGWTGE